MCMSHPYEIALSVSKKTLLDVIKRIINDTERLKEYEQELDYFIQSINNKKNLIGFTLHPKLLPFLHNEDSLKSLLQSLKYCENEDEDNFYRCLINHMLEVYKELEEDKPNQKIHTWLKLSPKQAENCSPMSDYNNKFKSILCKFFLKQYQKYTNRFKTSAESWIYQISVLYLLIINNLYQEYTNRSKISAEGWTYQISVLFLLLIDKLYRILENDITSIRDFLFQCFITINPVIVGFQAHTTFTLENINAIEVMHELFQIKPIANYLQIRYYKEKPLIEFIFTTQKGTFSHFEKPFEQNAFNNDRYVRLAVSGKGNELSLKFDIIGNSTFEDITGMACKKAFYSLITDETTLNVIAYRVLNRILSHTIQYSNALSKVSPKLAKQYEAHKDRVFAMGTKLEKEFEVKDILKKEFMGKKLFIELEPETFFKTALSLIKTFNLKKYEIDYVIIAIELAKLPEEATTKLLMNLGTKQQAQIRKMVGFVKQQEVIPAKALNILYNSSSWS